MAERLNGKNNESEFVDPLRLAEEFKCYFGHAALNDLIHELVPDRVWTPGHVHRALMDLPWSEVLTTNWDTLLERTPPGFGTVREAVDMVRVKQPRVIKLHGSIDSAQPLVISEEDYRTYTDRQAAFVNLARQVFLENELCLVGFSGDDPNFLQWTGWVRDHLGSTNRRIYLVGYLDLSPSKRRLLETRNVAPIDLTPLHPELPREKGEHSSIASFLAYLSSTRPPRRQDWRPTDAYRSTSEVEHHESSSHLSQVIRSATQVTQIWKQDRESCPSWLVLPRKKRISLRSETQFQTDIAWKHFDQLPPTIRLSYLRELLWRHTAALWPLEEHLALRLEKLIQQGASDDATMQELAEMGINLMQDARLKDNSTRFDLVASLVEHIIQPNSELAYDLMWQKILRARDLLEFDGLADQVALLNGSDPIWQMRRSALLAEIGQVATAKEVLSTGIISLNDSLSRDPRSIGLLSRRAWAETLSRVLDIAISGIWKPHRNFKEAYEIGYDPDAELDAVRSVIEEERSKQLDVPNELEPGFSPGGIRDRSSTITFRSASYVDPLDELLLLSDAGCLPLRVPSVDVAAASAMSAASLSFNASRRWFLLLSRVASNAQNELLERRLSREAIAAIPGELANELSKRHLISARFWLNLVGDRQTTQAAFGEARLKSSMQILSRLLVRAATDTVLEAFTLASSIAKSYPARFRMFEELGAVLDRSIGALPSHENQKLVLSCLEFPLPSLGLPAVSRWPNPVIYLWESGLRIVRPERDSEWLVQIERLIVASRADGEARKHAIARLGFLADNKTLNEAELLSFSQAVWKKTDRNKGRLPADTGLYTHVLLSFGLPIDLDVHEIVRYELFELDLSTEDSITKLSHILAAARAPASKRILPDRKTALRLMQQISGMFLSDKKEDGPLSMEMSRYAREIASETISYAVLPLFEHDDFSDEIIQVVLAACEEGAGGGGLIGLPQVVRGQPDLLARVIRTLRGAITGTNIWRSGHACESIRSWLSDDRLPPLPYELVSTLIWSVLSGSFVGLQCKLSCLSALLDWGFLKDGEKALLVEILQDLCANLAYGQSSKVGPSAVGLSIARAECVRLSASLEKLGLGSETTRIWLKLAREDPLPEVRSALPILDS